MIIFLTPLSEPSAMRPFASTVLRRAISTTSASPNRTPKATVPLAHLAAPPPDIAALPAVLAGCIVTPPVSPWPRRLTPRGLAALLRRLPSADHAFLAFRHAVHFASPRVTPTLPVFAALLARLAASPRLLPPVLSALRAARLRAFSDGPFLPLLRALPPLASLRLFLALPSFNSRPSCRSFNALLHALVAARRLRLAAALFHAAPRKLAITPNLVSCNILLKGLVGIGNLDAAFKVLDEMPGWGIVPDVVTYTTVLTAYCAKGDLAGARKLFDGIVSGGRMPDVTTYTVLIDGYCQCGQLQDAVRIMDEMEVAGLRPNEVTYSVVIEACCKEGKSAEARDLMREMLGASYVPDTSLCAKVVDVLCQDGKAEEACELWRLMLKKNVVPDNMVWCTLIYWLSKKGMVREARKLFDELKVGFVPNVLMYNTLILGLCDNRELQEAGRVWDDMVDCKCKPNVVTYDALIKGFCKVGKAKEGVSIFEEMLSQGCVPSKVTYQVLVDGLYESGDEEIVDKILEIAALSGQAFLDVDCWEIFVRKVVNSGDTLNRLLDTV